MGGGLDELTPDVQAIIVLRHAGWQIEDEVSQRRDGRFIWVVRGTNGEKSICVEGLNSAEAWGGSLLEAKRFKLFKKILRTS